MRSLRSSFPRGRSEAVRRQQPTQPQPQPADGERPPPGARRALCLRCTRWKPDPAQLLRAHSGGDAEDGAGRSPRGVTSTGGTEGPLLWCHCCQQSVGWKRGREDGARHGEGARAVRGDVRPGLSMGMWHQAQSMGVGHQGRPWGNETKKHPWGCDSGQYPWGCDTKRRPRRCDSRAVRGAVTAGTRCPAKERGWPRGHRAEADGAGTAPAAARRFPAGNAARSCLHTERRQGRAQSTELQGATEHCRATAKPPPAAPPELGSEHDTPRGAPGVSFRRSWVCSHRWDGAHSSSPRAELHLPSLLPSVPPPSPLREPKAPAGNGGQRGDVDVWRSVSKRSTEQTRAEGRAGGDGGRGDGMGGREERNTDFSALQPAGGSPAMGSYCSVWLPRSALLCCNGSLLLWDTANCSPSAASPPHWGPTAPPPPSPTATTESRHQ